MAELCRQFGLSRKNPHKWMVRFTDKGLDKLRGRSRAVYRHPNTTLREIGQVVILLYLLVSAWGSGSVVGSAPVRLPDDRMARSRYYRQNTKAPWFGQTPTTRTSRPGVPAALANGDQPNDAWCADFKGWFRTGDGTRCVPLTITYHANRFLIRGYVVGRPDCGHVQPMSENAFQEYGLPRTIRTDNGPPFATTTYGGPSRLAVTWIKMGIVHKRIAPGRPEQNGRHKRFHRGRPMLSARSTTNDRPHRALDIRTPGDMFAASPRPRTGSHSFHRSRILTAHRCVAYPLRETGVGMTNNCICAEPWPGRMSRWFRAKTNNGKSMGDDETRHSR